jgi:hypothetical protein
MHWLYVCPTQPSESHNIDWRGEIVAKAKSISKAAPSQEKSLRAALKFAKSKGLFKGDLRKPLSPYRAKIAKQYLTASKHPQNFVSVKVGRGAKAAVGGSVKAAANGRVLVQTDSMTTVRYSKKTKKLTATSTNFSGKKTKQVLTLVQDKPGMYGVPLYRGAGASETRWFDTAAAAVAMINEYANRQQNKGQKAISKSIADWINEIEFRPSEEEE